MAAVAAPQQHPFLRQWDTARGAEHFETSMRRVRRSTSANAVADTLHQLETHLNVQIGDDVVVGDVTAPPATALFRASAAEDEDGFRLPLSLEAAESLYSMGQPSQLGVEGQGDVYDTRLRSSREISLSGRDADPSFALPDVLERFAFAEARRRIHDDLCPTAAEIEIKPYKVVLYSRGDFFTAHVDSMSNPYMFGSLALQLPITFPAPRAKATAAAKAEAGTGDDEDEEDDGEQTELCDDDLDVTERPTSSVDGKLVFYLGRDVEPHLTDQSTHLLLNNRAGWSRAYGRDTAEDELRMVVDLTTPLPQPADGSVALKYAAWLGDVPHEVGRVTQPYRAVLLYRLYKRGERRAALLRRPVADVALAHVRAIFGTGPAMVSSASPPKPTDPPAALPWSFPMPADMPSEAPIVISCLGIILRHRYPAAGLTGPALKGIDAKVWELLTLHYECELLHAVECRDDYPTQPFRLRLLDSATMYSRLHRRVVATADDLRGSQDMDREDSFTSTVALKYPSVVALWAQLGYGQLFAGGRSYGNADCGADWWYRSAVLMVTPRPSKWQRARWLVLAAVRGHPQMGRLAEVRDVFEIVLSYV